MPSLSPRCERERVDCDQPRQRLRRHGACRSGERDPVGLASPPPSRRSGKRMAPVRQAGLARREPLGGQRQGGQSSKRRALVLDALIAERGPRSGVQNLLTTYAESVDADGSDPGAWTLRGRPRQRARCRRRTREDGAAGASGFVAKEAFERRRSRAKQTSGRTAGESGQAPEAVWF